MALTEEFRTTADRVRNWGRWGPADERGTCNFITPQTVAGAAALVQDGRVFSLALPMDDFGPMDPRMGRFNPIHRMTRYRGDNAFGQSQGEFSSSDDMVILPLQSSTQWDSLAHLWYGDQLYNGFPADTITAAGAAHCSITNVRAGVVSRGVLLDIARLKDVACLPPSYAITPDDLEAAEQAEGVQVGTGDVLLIRTGALGRWQSTGDFADQAGLEFSCAEWLHQREVAAVCADNMAVEVLAQPRNLPLCAFHMVALRDMGLMLGELWVLDELADDCALDGRYAFFLTAAPLYVRNAVGSALNPLAIK